MGVGTTEILLILVVVLLLFGAGKLPGVARKAGQAFREYRKATGEINKVKNPITWLDAVTKGDKREKQDSADKPPSSS